MNFIRLQAGGWEWYYQDYYWHMVECFLTDEERSISYDDLCERHDGGEDRELYPPDPLVHYV